MPMSEQTLTIRDFMEAAVGDDWITDSRRSGIETGNQIASLKEHLAEKHQGLQWSYVWGMVIDKVGTLLDFELKEVLLASWKKSEEILNCLDSTASSPDETKAVALAGHTIRSSHKPKLAVKLNGNKIGEILFSLDLALKLEGFILKIQGGEIREIQTGTCQGSGTFKCEDFVILEKKTGPIQLPGTIRLAQ